MTQEQKDKFNGIAKDIEQRNAELQKLALQIRMQSSRDEVEFSAISEYCDKVYNLTEDLSAFINF